MQYRDPRAAEARRLRREEGWSIAQIRAKLRVGNDKLTAWLKDVPPPEWTRRPNAKDALRAEARRLRFAGKTYDEIVEVLGVSKGSVSLWVRDIPQGALDDAPGWTPRARQHRSDNLFAKHARIKAQRLDDQKALLREMEPFNERDILINGAIAYWCEGAKTKPWRPNVVRVDFTNTDPDLHRLFQRFLDVVPVPHGSTVYRLDIHETGNEFRAKEYWCRELSISESDFVPTLWKRHNPKTVRKNVNDDYHGCLVARVRKPTKLYWYIENLAKAAMRGMSMATVYQGQVI